MKPFEVIPTSIEGCFEIQPRVFQDNRGKFVKIFHSELYRELGLMSGFEEEYYSVSQKGVIRGLHFQKPPHAHIKLVTCIQGKILDVVVDIRQSSPTFKKVSSLELDFAKGNMLYVPEGFAHGFYVLSDSCIFLSMNSEKFSPECDAGIRWNSIDFEWPDKNPVVSEKDQNMPALNEYQTPFN